MFDDIYFNGWEEIFDSKVNEPEKEDSKRLIDKVAGNGCIGALVFYGQAIGALDYDPDKFKRSEFAKAEIAFTRMVTYDIVGEDLFDLWHSCCSLNTKGAVQVMLDCDIEEIKDHIKNKKKYSPEEMVVGSPKKRDGQHWSFFILSGKDKGTYVVVKGDIFEAKEKFIKEYGKIRHKVIPSELLDHIIYDEERFLPKPKCLAVLE